MQHNGWDHALKVTADGAGLVGHAGAVLLRKAADQAGLTAWLSGALRKAGQSPVLDRGVVLVSMAAAIALGATSMSDIAVLAHLAPVLGDAPSGPTVRRALDLAGGMAMLDRIARARAKARAHVWQLIEGTAAGFPWLAIAGKTLTGWLVIDMDATLVTASSDKEGAAPTWKRGYGFHPLGAWLANTRECLAMLLRPGNAGSNTFTDHREVLAAAIRQVPARLRNQLNWPRGRSWAGRRRATCRRGLARSRGNVDVAETGPVANSSKEGPTPVPVRVSPADRIRHHIDELFGSDRPLPEILEEVARLGAQLLMQAALEAEVTEFLGRDRYARAATAEDARPGSRNGYREVTVKTTAGPVALARPKLRGTAGAFASRLYTGWTGDDATLGVLGPLDGRVAVQPDEAGEDWGWQLGGQGDECAVAGVR